MTYNKTKHLEYLDKLAHWGRLKNHILGPRAFAFVCGFAKSDLKDREKFKEQYFDELKKLASEADIKEQNFAQLVGSYMDQQVWDWKKSFGAKDKPEASEPGDAEKQILAILQSKVDGIFQQLSKIEPTIEKAKTTLLHEIKTEAEGNSFYDLFPDVLQILFSTEPELVEYQTRRIRKIIINSELPHSPKFWENEWYVSYISFAEKNGLTHSSEVVSSLTADLEAEFKDSVASFWGRRAIDTLYPDFSALFFCWTCSSSPRLRARLAHQASAFLNELITWQSPDGSWLDPYSDTHPSSDITALAVHCLIKYNDGEDWKEQIKRGLEWLLEHPNPQGGWGNPKSKNGEGRNLNIVTTVAALEAMRISGISLEHQVIERAEQALLKSQNETGLWTGIHGEASVYLTGVALGYFQRREQRLERMHEATALGRGFLLKAQALKEGSTSTDQVLALISTYHGLEYVLYGFLEAVEISYRGKDGRTIGLDESLNRFREYAERKEWIIAGAGLPHETQIGELKARRDEVIHRVQKISPTSVDHYLSQVWKFVERFDLKVLGYTILE